MKETYTVNDSTCNYFTLVMDWISQTTILTKFKPAVKMCFPDWPLNSLKLQTLSSSSAHTDREESLIEKCFKLWTSAKLFGINLRHEITCRPRAFPQLYITALFVWKVFLDDCPKEKLKEKFVTFYFIFQLVPVCVCCQESLCYSFTSRLC